MSLKVVIARHRNNKAFTHVQAALHVVLCVLFFMQPGFLRPQLPDSAPQQPEPWQDIKQDFFDKIMRGELCYYVLCYICCNRRRDSPT
jgi:hypothetical protein